MVFVYSFLPIFIFILVDSLWGEVPGLIVAILSGIIELIWEYKKSKKIEKIILVDIGFLVILGGVSLLLNNEIYFRLKPAAIQLVFLVIIGISAFSDYPILLKMTGRYMKNFNLEVVDNRIMKKIFSIFFWVLLFHTVLIVYSAFFLSKKWWAFISGFLLYIILGVIFLFYLIKSYLSHRKYSEEEWFDLVDVNGNVIGKAPRSVCHSNPKLLHPVVHLHVFNSKGELLLQKRSKNKDIQPDKWDTAVGGHISSGEDVITALMRETREELGFFPEKYWQLAQYIMTNEIESEFVYSFFTVYDGPFEFDRNEISEIKFWTVAEIDKANKSDFTPNFLQELEILRRTMFKKNI